MLAGVWQVLKKLFWLLFSVVLIWLSVANRAAVDIALTPFNYAVRDVPLFLIFFTGILVGLVLAAAVTGWLRLRAFTRHRKTERRADFLSEQVSELAETKHKDQAEIAHRAATD